MKRHKLRMSKFDFFQTTVIPIRDEFVVDSLLSAFPLKITTPYAQAVACKRQFCRNFSNCSVLSIQVMVVLCRNVSSASRGTQVNYSFKDRFLQSTIIHHHNHRNALINSSRCARTNSAPKVSRQRKAC